MLLATERDTIRRFTRMVRIIEQAMAEALEIWNEAERSAQDRALGVLGRAYPRTMNSFEEVVFDVTAWREDLEKALEESAGA